MGITLSKRQIGDANRIGGIELLISWPQALGPEPADLADDCEREATARERTHTLDLIGAECTRHELIPLHVRVARVKHLPQSPQVYRVHLAVVLVGERWADVTVTRRAKGRQAFARSTS